MRQVIVVIFLLVFRFAWAQQVEYDLTGYILDSDNNPVPYATVYVKELETGKVTDEYGRYQFAVEEGIYDLVVSFVGFEKSEVKVVVQGESIQQNIYLKSAYSQLSEVVITKKNKDIAYGMIQRAINNKKKHRFALGEYSCKQYLKGREDLKIKKKRPKEGSKKMELYLKDSLRIDSLIMLGKIPPSMSLLEVHSTLQFRASNRYKEIKHAEKSRGNTRRIWRPDPGPSVFNLYYNVINSSLSESPYVSPLSNAAFVSYRFKHIDVFKKQGEIYHRILVIPKAIGNALLEGYLILREKDWSVSEFNLKLPQNTLLGYDQFSVFQTNFAVNDSTYAIDQESFKYVEQYGNRKYVGTTTIHYSQYNLDTLFSKRYFNNEVRRVDFDAYQKDSLYWSLKRPEPLTPEEQEYAAYADSIAAMRSKESYLDSMEKEYNKVTFANILLYGQPIVNRKKKRIWYLGSIAGMISPFNVGGFRTEYWSSFYKQYDDRRTLFCNPRVSYGYRNQDIKFDITASYFYNPFNFSRTFVKIRKDFEMINWDDNILNQARRQNYIQATTFRWGHYREFFNGLGFSIRLDYELRESLEGFKTGTFMDQVFEDNTLTEFENFTSAKGEFSLSYTPGMKYIREAKRKVRLGSKWPTILGRMKIGVPDFLGSVSDFTSLEFDLDHKVSFKTLGSGRYTITTGKFLNTNNINLVDYTYMRGADPFIFLFPQDNFQLLESTFPVFDWFLEAHYVHQFNGVIMNKFPFLKKFKIRSSAGGSFLYSMDDHYRHQELFAGLEKDFKLFKERYRIGLFYTVGNSNQGNQLLLNQIKFSIKHFDRKNKGFRF